MPESLTTVNLAALAVRESGRNAETQILVGGITAGRGPNRKAATDEAAATVAGWLDNMTRESALVRESDGSLWFIWPDRDGHGMRRVRPDGSASNGTSYGRGRPSEEAGKLVANHEGAVRVF